MIKTVSQVVATCPIPEQSIKTTVSQGFAMAEQKITLTPLNVLFDAQIGENKFTKGDVVYVKGEAYAAAWSKHKYRVGEEEFILVPIVEILLHETEEK